MIKKRLHEKYVQTTKKNVKKTLIFIKKYLFRKNRKICISKPQIIIFFEDGNGIHYPGLVDRLKAIVGMYHIATVNEFDFKIVHTASFLLEDYLLPNKVKWVCSSDQVSSKIGQFTFLDYNPFVPAPVLNHDIKQYHTYFHIGYSILEENHVENWEEIWRRQFWTLFMKSPYLQSIIDLNKPSNHFVSIHLRFVNALENFEKGYPSNLSSDEKQKLIHDCMIEIEKIERKHKNLKIVVFSDSASFLNIARDRGFCTLDSDALGHVSFQSNRETMDKTFTDFFVMSESSFIYSIRGRSLYNSVFAKYASIVGDTPYSEVIIDEMAGK